MQELKIPEAYFTHISHQLGKHEEIEKDLPKGIHLAYDGLNLTPGPAPLPPKGGSG